MRLSLISHAATRALRRAAFPLDEAIEPVDPARVAALVERLPVADQIWTSKALRTVQTAVTLKLEAQVAQALDDCDYGRWAGQRMTDVQRDEPEALHAWLQDASASAHGGESLQEMHARVAAWMDGLDGKADHIVAITHPAVVRSAILHALGAGLTSFWHIDINPLSLTDLRRGGGRWTVRSIGA
jgi:broad specificity phosphatase PhoE